MQPAEPTWRLAWRFAISDGVPRRSLIVAVVVGTLINLINQGDVLFGAAIFSPVKFGLTYIVPYFVATYGAVSMRLATLRR